MNKPQKEQESVSDIKRKRTSSRYSVIVILLLSLALVGGSSVTEVSSGSDVVPAVAWTVLSGLAMLTFAWATFTNYRQSDERQQVVQLKAAALTFIVVLLSLFAAELLYATFAINLNVAIQVIFIVGILLCNTFVKVIDRNKL